MCFLVYFFFTHKYFEIFDISKSIIVYKRKTKLLRLVQLNLNDTDICHHLNMDATSAWRNVILVSSWSSDVLTWKKCCRCAKGLVQREVTQGLEILLLSALSEVLTSSTTGWWSTRRMICLLLWARHESAVINYSVQHPVTDSSDSNFCREAQAAMHIEEQSNFLSFQEIHTGNLCNFGRYEKEPDPRWVNPAGAPPTTFIHHQLTPICPLE